SERAWRTAGRVAEWFKAAVLKTPARHAVRCRPVLIGPVFLAKIGQRYRRDSTLYQSVLLSWVPIRVASRSAMLARRPMDSRDREIQIIAEEICAQVPGAMLSRTDGSLYLEPTDCRTIAMRIV